MARPRVSSAAPRTGHQAPQAEEYRRAAELREALRRFHRHSKQVTRAHGLTPQRYELLLMIKTSMNGGDGATLSELARRLELAQSTTTELVHRAEDVGLVRRKLSSTRRGGVRFHLTREGERRLVAVFCDLGGERRRLTSLITALEAVAAD